MLKIALVKVPPTYANWYHRPVIGLAYLAAVLRQNGYEVKIFDGYYHNWKTERLIQEILAYSPNLVGFTAMTHEVEQTSQIAQRMKDELSCLTIIGGCHVTALPDRTLAEYPSFDYGVVGEGEKTILELLEYLERPGVRSRESIHGLLYRENGKVMHNEPRAFMTDEELNALPLPDYTDYYRDDKKALHHRNDEYILFSTRGCPYHCVFCMQVLGHKIRQRSTESIIREINLAIERYGAHTFDFADEIFLINRPSTINLLQYLIESGLAKKIRWTGLTRANLVTKELIDLARRAGCIRLSMGVESGDDVILKTIKKNITIQQIHQAVSIVKDAKIPLSTYYILGHPGETTATARKTIDLAIALNTKNIAVGLMVPYPGTRVYEMAKNHEMGYSLMNERWEEYDKYGGRALRIEGLPYEELERLQMQAIAKLYLLNQRWFDMLLFAWSRRVGVYYLLKKKLLRRA